MNIKKNIQIAEVHYFDEKNYSNAKICFEFCLELIEDLLSIKTKIITVNTKKSQSNQYLNINKFQTAEIDMNQKKSFHNDCEFSSKMVDKIYLNREICEFIQKKEDYIKKFKIRILHFIVSCYQKLSILSRDNLFYIEKIIVIANSDWIALAKKGLHLYMLGDYIGAIRELKKVNYKHQCLSITKEIAELIV